MSVEFRVLGPLEVTEGGRNITPRGHRERALLAALLLSADRVVSVERLADDLWAGEPPPGSSQSLRVYVSRLRRALGPAAAGAVVTQVPGYMVRLGGHRLDAVRFEALVGRGRAAAAAGRYGEAAAAFRAALELWRGPALGDLADAAFARADAARLEEARLAALEHRIQADLACGRHEELTAELEALTRAHPLRERLWAHRMLALYRSGRQAEALRAYQQLRRVLRDGLGIEPGASVRQLEAAILRQDTALERTTSPTTFTAAGNRPGPGALPSLLAVTNQVFVDREAETDRLRDAWRRAVAGTRHVVLVGGEPGVGKSRLAARFAHEVHATGTVVLAGRCDEGLGVPYQPFVEALRHFVDCTPEEALPRSLGRFGGELVRLMPELEERLSERPVRLRSDPETERYRLFDAVVGWLAAAAADHPVVLLVLDDLQWAARPTLLLLRHIARGPDSQRLLVLGTYRDTESPPESPLAELLADLRGEPSVERLSLKGLGSVAVADFMEQAAGRPLGVEDLRLADAIHYETGGNPFFVREVLRHVEETAALEPGDGGITGLLAEELGIPDSVREVVSRRIARLSDPARRLLRVACVIGPGFELALLEQVEPFEEEELAAALEEAATAGLIGEVPQAIGRYRFAHAIVRDTLYHDLSGVRRTALHRRVAQAIERVHAGALDDHLPGLAYHWVRAGRAEDTAAQYAVRAGDRAAQQLAHDEAVKYYRQALGLLSGIASDDDDRRLEVLIKLGDAQRCSGTADYRETLLEAARLANQRRDPARLARAALGSTRGFLYGLSGGVDVERVEALETALTAAGSEPTATRARLLAALAVELTFAPERDRRLALSDGALKIARQLGNPDVLAHVLSARYVAASGFGSPCLEARELERFLPGIEDPAIRVRALITLFRSLFTAGEVGAAADYLRRADELAVELGQPALQWSTTYLGCAVALLRGDLAEAERLARAGCQLGRLTRQPDADWAFSIELFLIRLEQGCVDSEVERTLDAVRGEVEARGAKLPLVEIASAVTDIELGRDDRARERLVALGPGSLPADVYWGISSVLWAEAAVRLDDTAQCQWLYEQLGRHPEHVVPYANFPTPSVRHHLGLLATALGRHDEAEAHFAVAAAEEERMGAPGYRARTQLGWAALLARRGAPADLGRAEALVGDVVDTARRLGLTGLERRAIALSSRTRTAT